MSILKETQLGTEEEEEEVEEKEEGEVEKLRELL